MTKVFITLFLIICSLASAKTFYVSTTGKDSNSGSFSSPWATWGKAFTSVIPGDTVYFRGGTYMSTVTNGSGYNVHITGLKTNTICFVNYRGEVPILDFNNVNSTTGNLNYGLRMNLTYVKIKGLTVRNVWQLSAADECVGWQISGSHIAIENCIVYNIGGAGFRDYDCTDIHFINCDAHDCIDLLTTEMPGNDGYGFASWNGTTRTGSTYFKNCRAWKNGDDGFSFWNISYIEADNCWSFCNGRMEGGGSGYKIGFTADYPTIPLQRVIKNCIAAYNRMDGIFTNEGGTFPSQNMYVFNNTSYHNGYYQGWPTYGFGFWVDNTSSTDESELARIFKNNISYDNVRNLFLNPGALYTHSFNTWDHSPAINITDADFISLDSTGLSAPRNEQGSLPDLDFLKLKEGSDLIDAGTDVGIPYHGKAPDLGWYESSSDISSTAKPVYVNSVVENSNPDKLTMTYSIDLLNLIPSPTAFPVYVNSVSRTINSVSISGTRVILTLSSPVIYGDVVTVAYTSPSTNPLQTALNGQALTIGAQPVTNNVISPIKEPQVFIYPNPAHRLVNFRINDQSLAPDLIRIIDLTGRIVVNLRMSPDMKEIQVPINLIEGVYIVQLLLGKISLFAQKLVVDN